MLISSIIWFAAVPLREKLAFGLVFSIIFQEIFRFLIYLLLSKADAYLRKLTENESTRIFANRHILSYGKFKFVQEFGIISRVPFFSEVSNCDTGTAIFWGENSGALCI